VWFLTISRTPLSYTASWSAASSDLELRENIMSVIFGTCLADNAFADEQALSRLAEATTRYGGDGTYIACDKQIGMGFQAFHTHARSQLERQPATDPLGNRIVLDGRLDNHEDLAERGGFKKGSLSDSDLVLSAFARYGEDCFSRLVGDWALALWSAKDCTLYLARDHAGSRTLFYQNRPEKITWSTYLETLVFGDNDLELDREYLGRHLALQQLRELTPYKGIRAVPPAHYLVVRSGRVTIHRHWRWIATTPIRYKSDTEYDEHFLQLFGQAVARRTGPGAPILAELSGGMDSSSIVCMADAISANRTSSKNQLETISYFDDTEPDWDERPYLTAVEDHRKKEGIHFDCSTQHPSYKPLLLSDRVYPYLGGDSASLHRAEQFARSVGEGRFRVILSGIGGDELLGGVPTPLPELSNHLRAGRLVTLVCRSVEWCLLTREPLLHMLYEVMTFTGSLYRSPKFDQALLPAWLSPELRGICVKSNVRTESLRDLLPALPSSIVNGQTWWTILETLPHLSPNLLGCYEYRYPYLDRDLVEFLHRVPREQLIQPGRRRQLMRRALRTVVPTTILERKRKAYISRGPIANLRIARQDIEGLFSDSLAAGYGLLDREQFVEALQAELTGGPKWIAHLTCAIKVELWLRSLAAQPVCLTLGRRDNHTRAFPPASSGRSESV
jgi:asparagine synthase (glutamine-hydrolysing)